MRRVAPRILAGIFALVAVDAAAIALAPALLKVKPSDYAIVFGNTVNCDGSPSPRLRARLDTALDLYRRGQVRRILVSGGFEQETGFDEADVMSRYLQLRSVPAEVIAKDLQGLNSLDTARNARAMLPADASVVVVTQWFHVARASLALHRAGFRAVSAASPRFAESRDAYSFVREIVALPFYAVKPMPALHASRPQT